MSDPVKGTDTVAWTKSKIEKASRDANIQDFDNYSEALVHWKRFKEMVNQSK